uniref:Uncharacterized protein n=1 Tax=Leersia perrieri TaxID=77586 RepID=A0A0D9V662_9ORYZ
MLFGVNERSLIPFPFSPQPSRRVAFSDERGRAGSSAAATPVPSPPPRLFLLRGRAPAQAPASSQRGRQVLLEGDGDGDCPDIKHRQLDDIDRLAQKLREGRTHLDYFY